jgi:hypothetical protein
MGRLPSIKAVVQRTAEDALRTINLTFGVSSDLSDTELEEI